MLRTFDFLMVSDFSGMAVVTLSAVSQTFDLFVKNNFAIFSQAISTPEIFCSRLDFKTFSQSLWQIRFTR